MPRIHRFLSSPARQRTAWAAALSLVLALPVALPLIAQQETTAPDATAEETPAEEASAEPPSRAEVLRIRIDSPIHPVAAQFVEDSLAEADLAGAEVLVIELSTPGGLVTSMRRIFTAMLGAATPVVVYVSPSGAQAASAGFYILLASDVAAMAPGTNTGAAAVVGAQGEDIEGTMGEKMQQDAAATARSLATRHGRNVELAESAVLEARSFSAEEALEGGLIDLVAPSMPRLLTAIDGRELEKHGESRRLSTAEAPVRELTMTAFQRFLAALAHPNIAYLLLTLGGLGIYFELMNPGAIFPGVFGAIALLLAFFGLSVLPVSYAGVALIALALAFFIAELKVPSFGLLTAAGVISLVLGSVMLFKTPEPALRVSRELIAAVAGTAIAVVAFLAFVVMRTYRSQVRTGVEGMVHEEGVARSELAPRGKVFVHGELWDAESVEPVAAGEAVEVTAVNGMRLQVRPLAGSAVEASEE